MNYSRKQGNNCLAQKIFLISKSKLYIELFPNFTANYLGVKHEIIP